MDGEHATCKVMYSEILVMVGYKVSKRLRENDSEWLNGI